MSTLGSCFGDLRAAVFRHHAEIRARLRGLDAFTSPASPPLAAAQLRVAVLRLAVLVESHLSFEEHELAPCIRELDAWGKEREAALLAEHVEQRARLQYICLMAESEQTSDRELACEVSWLVVSLLDDMSREEAELMELERLSTDGPLEQMTG